MRFGIGMKFVHDPAPGQFLEGWRWRRFRSSGIFLKKVLDNHKDYEIYSFTVPS